jgi:hypothetical protein
LRFTFEEERGCAKYGPKPQAEIEPLFAGLRHEDAKLGLLGAAVGYGDVERCGFGDEE